MGNSQGVSSGDPAEKKIHQISAISSVHMKLRKFRARRKLREKKPAAGTPILISKAPTNSQLLKLDEVRDIQDTLPYVRLHLNAILHDAFINMFVLNPDIKAKFFTFKDYSIQDLKIQEGRKKRIIFQLSNLRTKCIEYLHRINHRVRLFHREQCVAKAYSKGIASL